jgi:hypothetical protein
MRLEESWPRCPEAASLCEGLLERFLHENPMVQEMAHRFHAHAGVRLANLIDHWVVPRSILSVEELERVGMIESDVEGEPVWHHPQARLPRFRVGAQWRLAIAVEALEPFLQQNRWEPDRVEGDYDSAYQEAVGTLPQGELAVVVRRGYRGFRPGRLTEEMRVVLEEARRRLRVRPRDDEALVEARRLVEELVDVLGAGRATDEFFAAEREYYMKRNRAARWQYARQQELGLGWANHDHHTYRSSRESFADLMELWRTSGFQFRERFYAGAEAGWGAQVLEHPDSRVVIFSDVDLSPEELFVDFAEQPLEPRDSLGTIGLWCALHGDSIGEAGMHHLEAEYDWEQVRALLMENGFGVMKPFTDLPILKQAFTEPEMWPVREERCKRLLQRGQITEKQAERFLWQGAAGSHLEILQRWEGYKGFNQAGVSAIIRETDARKLAQ